MNKNIFRKQALDKITSPKQLDALIKINSSLSWVFLIALGLFVVFGILWGVFGIIPTKVKGTGMIVTSHVIVKLQAPISGEVVILNVKAGDNIKEGQILARIKQPQLEEKVKHLLSRIETLKHNLQVLDYLNQSELKTEIGFLSQQEKSLNEGISELTSHENWYADFAKKNKELRNKGSISDLNYHEVIKELSSVKMDIYNREDQLQDIMYKKTLGLSKLRKEYLSKEQEIEEMEIQLKEIQFELDQRSIIRSPSDGKILELLIGNHQVIQTGADFATMLKRSGEDEDLEALVFFSSSEGKKIKRCMFANVVPLTVNPSKYGFIRAIVENVDEYPSSSAGMLNTLHNPDLVKMLTKDGAPIMVKLDLMHSSKTISGMEWTSSNGPPFMIEAGTICSGSVIVKEEPPISFVLPFLKKIIMGYED